jgi:hypothetical protein
MSLRRGRPLVRARRHCPSQVFVRVAGKLADPTDLPFDESHLDEPGVLRAAVDDLIARKRHLARKRPSGEIGQGASPSTSTADLAKAMPASDVRRVPLRASGSSPTLGAHHGCWFAGSPRISKFASSRSRPFMKSVHAIYATTMTSLIHRQSTRFGRFERSHQERFGPRTTHCAWVAR